MERFIKELYMEHYGNTYDCSHSFSMESFCVDREAYIFEYITNLLERKNFGVMEDTVSVMDFKELERMKPKSRYDIRHVHQVEPEKKDNVSHPSLLIHHTLSDSSKKTRSHSSYDVANTIWTETVVKRSKSVNDAHQIKNAIFKRPKTLKRCKSLQKVSEVERPKSKGFSSMSCLYHTSSLCETSAELNLVPLIDTDELFEWSTFANLSFSSNHLLGLTTTAKYRTDTIKLSKQSTRAICLKRNTESRSKVSKLKRHVKQLKKSATAALYAFSSFFELQLRQNNTSNCLLLSL